MKILIVDDEKVIVKGLKYALENDGMETDAAYDGEEALEMIKQGGYDLVLLDMMLPKLDGMEVCRSVREFSDVPIVFLTARGDDMDKIMGLESGADDYITKPFNMLEVRARIKGIVRRSRRAAAPVQKKPNVVVNGGFVFDADNRRLTIDGVEINLTSKEYEILEILVTNPRKIYSRDALLKAVWGDNYAGDARTVDVHVRRLREKIEKMPGEPKYVQTKWGAGYFYKG
ncbi:MAG: response regulator transcription factor [Lachnospiraceae bacterium]|jgi:DNA-binding response OmpR family regulator|nr:response regulator transcription factor [Lachnospiraceae bacterium]MCR5389400.1 response regulator transcription factor [Lachnospiraceae bacterium]